MGNVNEGTPQANRAAFLKYIAKQKIVHIQNACTSAFQTQGLLLWSHQTSLPTCDMSDVIPPPIILAATNLGIEKLTEAQVKFTVKIFKCKFYYLMSFPFILA